MSSNYKDPKSKIIYSIIRFCPYVETEEFINTGIVALNIETGEFDFSISTRNNSRISSFFNDLNKDYYSLWSKGIKSELGNLKNEIETMELFVNPVDVFNRITSPAEDIVQFSNTRVTLVDGNISLNEVIENLYKRYVLLDLES